MPSGGAQSGRQVAEAAGGVDGAMAQGEVVAAAVAVDEPGRAAARQTLGRARAGAETAMHAAAAVGHGRLAAAAAGPRAGAATRRGQEIAGGIAVLQAAAARARGSMEFTFGSGGNGGRGDRNLPYGRKSGGGRGRDGEPVQQPEARDAVPHQPGR